MKQKLLYLFLALLTMTTTYSQCNVEYLTTADPSSGGPYQIGQSFIAECTGNITSFQLYAVEIGTVTSGTLNIYNGNTNTGTPIYTQSHPDIIITAVGDPIILDISGNFPLILNNQYTFEFTSNINFFYNINGTYAGGETWLPTGALTGYDLSFSVAINDGTLGIENFNLENKIKLIPNPSSDFIQIHGLSLNKNYTIYDALGRKMVEGIILNNKVIDIQNYSNGIYFLKFDNGNTIKFIKE